MESSTPSHRAIGLSESHSRMAATTARTQSALSTSASQTSTTCSLAVTSSCRSTTLFSIETNTYSLMRTERPILTAESGSQRQGTLHLRSLHAGTSMELTLMRNTHARRVLLISQSVMITNHWLSEQFKRDQES